MWLENKLRIDGCQGQGEASQSHRLKSRFNVRISFVGAADSTETAGIDILPTVGAKASV